MDFFDHSYFKLIKRLASFLGIWPFQSTWEKRLHRMVYFSSMTSIMIPEVIMLCKLWNGAKERVFECVVPLVLHVCVIGKMTSSIINDDKLKNLLERMKIDWTSRDKEFGSEILRNYAERGRIIALYYTLYLYGGSFLYVGAPLVPLILDVVNPLNESRPLAYVFHAEYFVDREKFFIPIFIHAFITTSWSMTIVAAFDSVYGTCVQYTCAVLEELCQEFENSVKDIDNDSNNFQMSKDNDYACRNVVKCIKKHKDAIECVNILESTYTMYFLFIMGTNILLLSFTGVQTIENLDDVESALRYGCFAVGQAGHVLHACWHGQMITDHSSRIHEAIYNCLWYRISPRSQKLTIPVMMRSSEPCQLTAGNIFFVSLETFSTIMKTSMSYLTVLTSMR